MAAPASALPIPRRYPSFTVDLFPSARNSFRDGANGAHEIFTFSCRARNMLAGSLCATASLRLPLALSLSRPRAFSLALTTPFRRKHLPVFFVPPLIRLDCELHRGSGSVPRKAHLVAKYFCIYTRWSGGSLSLHPFGFQPPSLVSISAPADSSQANSWTRAFSRALRLVYFVPSVRPRSERARLVISAHHLFV